MQTPATARREGALAPDIAHDPLRSVDVEAALLNDLRADAATTGVATAILVILAVLFSSAWTFFLAITILVFGAVRQLARPALRRGRIGLAVAITTAGTWGVAAIVVAVIPLVFPIMVFNLVGPLVVSATFLDDRQHRAVTAIGFVVALGLGLIGFTQRGVGVIDDVEPWIVQTVAVGFLAGHTFVFSSTVRTASRMRLGALHAALDLNEHLHDTARELQQSRRRLVSVADQERIRIERNIHDGAQQRLVSLAMQLRLASQLSAAGRPPDPDALAQLQQEAVDALDELRTLASGIFPPLLADRGLADALAAAVHRSQIPVTVAVDPDLGLDPDREAALYFVALEALQNTAKHGGPGVRAWVSIERTATDVAMRIDDNGLGADLGSRRQSRGLLNMADRMAAAGGDLQIVSTPGKGLSVIGRLPVTVAGPASASPSATEVGA